MSPLHAGVTRVANAVTADTDACAMLVVFLSSYFADDAYCTKWAEGFSAFNHLLSGKKGARQLLARDVPKWHTMCPRFLCRPGACAIGDWICLSSVPEVVSRTGSTRCSVVASL